MISDGRTVKVASFAVTMVEAVVGIATVWLPMATLAGRTTIRTWSIVVVNGAAETRPVGDAVANGELRIEAMILPTAVVVAGATTNVPGVAPALLLTDGKVSSEVLDAVLALLPDEGTLLFDTPPLPILPPLSPPLLLPLFPPLFPPPFPPLLPPLLPPPLSPPLPPLAVTGGALLPPSPVAGP